MFKTQTKKIKLLILLWALLGLIRSIFFLRKNVFGWIVNNLLQETLNIIESNQPIEAIFEGKITESIYEKALEAETVESAKITNAALEDMQFINSWVTIKKEDLLNILYYTNNNINYAMNKVCENKKSCNITQKDISKSYDNIIKELHQAKILSTNNNNLITRKKVDSRVNNNFILFSNNESSFKQFETASIWEDLFINGVLEDGDYDLQVDMENIGNLLFESFISPIETVFYKLPTSKKGSSANGWNNSNNNSNESIKDILQKALNQINTGVITNWGEQNIWWQNSTSQNPQTTNKQITTDLDTDLKNFIAQNKVTQQEDRQKIGGVAGDICREEIESNEIISQTEGNITTPSFQEIENYLKEAQNEISSYNNTYPENQIAPNINNILSGMDPKQANAFVEDYINDFFNTESTESCLKSCNSLPASERIICQIQCLCFTMWRPSDKDPRVKNMNEMLKLRFCMVPAKSIAIPRGKSIYSLDDILERIKANMEDTIQWGQMVKFQKTKEFLDNPIADLKRDKVISFQINVNMKPLFSNKSALAKKDQEKTALEKLEQSAGKEQSPWTNNNKYVIIQDIAKNKVYKEYAWDFEEYQNKYNQEVEKINQEKNEKENSFKQTNVINDQKASFLTTLTDFLDKNLAFRKETEKKLQNINNVVNALESKL